MINYKGIDNLTRATLQEIADIVSQLQAIGLFQEEPMKMFFSVFHKRNPNLYKSSVE